MNKNEVGRMAHLVRLIAINDPAANSHLYCLRARTLYKVEGRTFALIFRKTTFIENEQRSFFVNWKKLIAVFV